MTGTVSSVRGKQQSYCRILDSSGTEYFAHQMDFYDPSAMAVGNEVEFQVKRVKTGPRPAATDIVLIRRAKEPIAA